MEGAKTIALYIVVIIVSSCGLQMDRDRAEAIRLGNQMLIESTIKFNKEKEGFVKDIADFNTKMTSWRQRRDEFLRSLSNEELKAYSEIIEASANHNEAKSILAFRNFVDLLIKSDSPKKIITYRHLVQEAQELFKKENELNARLQDIQRREYRIAKFEEDAKERRKHEETVSAIKGISSSIDSMRFDLEQWRMQRFIGMR